MICFLKSRPLRKTTFRKKQPNARRNKATLYMTILPIRNNRLSHRFDNRPDESDYGAAKPFMANQKPDKINGFRMLTG